MVATLALVLGQEVLDRLWAKEPTATDGVGPAHLADERSKRAAEPMAEWHTEALFRSREDFGRESVGDCPFEDVLRLEASQLQVHREPRCQLHDSTVEERHPHFQ